MEIQVIRPNLKKIYAEVTEGISLHVYDDNTATVVQSVIQTMPSNNFFYNQMYKQATQMSKPLRGVISSYLKELNVSDEIIYNVLNEVEVMFLKFPDYEVWHE